MNWFRKKEKHIYSKRIDCIVGAKKQEEVKETLINLFNFNESKVFKTCGYVSMNDLVESPCINVSSISKLKNGSCKWRMDILSYNLMDVITLQHLIGHILTDRKIKYEIMPMCPKGEIQKILRTLRGK